MYASPPGGRVTAVLKVRFGGPSDSRGDPGLSLEIDSRPGGLNGGRTSFRAGDPVWYLMRKSPDLTLAIHKASSGTIGPPVTALEDVEDVISFLASPTSEDRLSRAPVGPVLLEWLTAPKGTPELMGDSVVLQDAGLEPVGAVVARYQAAATAYRLSGVPLGHRSVLVFAAGYRNA